MLPLFSLTRGGTRMDTFFIYINIHDVVGEEGFSLSFIFMNPIGMLFKHVPRGFFTLSLSLFFSHPHPPFSSFLRDIITSKHQEHEELVPIETFTKAMLSLRK